jgi:hypothetical protein
MKKYVVVSVVMLAISFVWIGANRAPLPELPEIDHLVGKEVKLRFKMNKFDQTKVELALAEKKDKMFVKFSMSDAWKEGRLGLVVDGMSEKSYGLPLSPSDYAKNEKRESQKGKDFGMFMKDKKGKPVEFYTFSQTVAEGKDGKQYLKMTYEGPDVPLIEMLEVKGPITVPPKIAKRFGLEKDIQIQPGKAAYDRSVNGFWLPVSLE